MTEQAEQRARRGMLKICLKVGFPREGVFHAQSFGDNSTREADPEDWSLYIEIGDIDAQVGPRICLAEIGDVLLDFSEAQTLSPAVKRRSSGRESMS